MWTFNIKSASSWILSIAAGTLIAGAAFVLVGGLPPTRHASPPPPLSQRPMSQPLPPQGGDDHRPPTDQQRPPAPFSPAQPGDSGRPDASGQPGPSAPGTTPPPVPPRYDDGHGQRGGDQPGHDGGEHESWHPESDD